MASLQQQYHGKRIGLWPVAQIILVLVVEGSPLLRSGIATAVEGALGRGGEIEDGTDDTHFIDAAERR